MKTNVVLQSSSRQLFGVTIRQETKTGFLNLSDLQKAYDKAKGENWWDENGWKEKRIDHLLPQVENRERVFFILNECGIINVGFRTFMEDCESKGFYAHLKDLGVYTTKGKGANRSTWCNPYIWALVAMELNPMIYAKVVIWLTDKLIINRITAGNMYVGLTKAISKFPDVDYARVAMALNYIVFGMHETGIRNKGSEAQLDELLKLEINMAFVIDCGFLSTFDDVMNHLRSEWGKKWATKTLLIS